MWRGVINRLWMASNSRRCRTLRQALANPERAQRDYLGRLLAAQADTTFGREHGFARLAGIDGYRESVPICDWNEVQPWVDRICSGEKKVLTSEPIELLEPTSGTGSARKLVPYSRRLRDEFMAGIGPWLVALNHRFPEIGKGRAYWSITPPAELTDESSAVRIGFADDSEYLGPIGSLLHRALSVVPDLTGVRVEALGELRLRTASALLAAGDLSLISVWSPTFLTLLLEYLDHHFEEVLDHLAKARTCNAERLRILRGRMGGARPWVASELWPQLQVVSCWTDAASARHAHQLQQELGEVPIQPKGLLATEAMVSFPWLPDRDPVLALTSHFFEFETESGKVLLAHQLERGMVVEVVVTTGGGLYRYRLGDRVEVTGRIGGAPTLRFVGRTGVTADHRGEKLDASFVESCIERLPARLVERFALLAPVDEPDFGYVLFVDCDDPAVAREACVVLEEALCENYHYRQCRRLGQLSAARIALVRANGSSPKESWMVREMVEGKRAGDIKPSVLDSRTDWDEHLSVSAWITVPGG